MRLSVVIGVRDGWPAAERCLAALRPQMRADTEVLVADGSPDGMAKTIGWVNPWVTLLREPPASGLAELRATGVARSRGEIVALTDPCCRVAPDWVARLLGEPWQRFAAIGGVVAPARPLRRSGWAAFLSEYGPHLPGSSAGPATILPGNNVAFRRDALERAGLIGEREFWKVFALQRLAARGERFWVDPSLVVHHRRSTQTSEFAYHRYLHGRCFGANRAAELSMARRLALAVVSPLFPGLLTARQIKAVYPHRRFRRALWESLPCSILFHAAWSAGELDGYLRGRGDACARLA